MSDVFMQGWSEGFDVGAMRKAIALLAVALLAAGCGAETDDTGTVQSGDNTPESVNSFWVQAVDGRRIPCVWVTGYNRAGLSCDWGQR